MHGLSGRNGPVFKCQPLQENRQKPPKPKQLGLWNRSWFASGGEHSEKQSPVVFELTGSLLLPTSLIALTAGLKRNLILNTQNLKLFKIMFPKIALIIRETANGLRFAPWLACHFWIHLFHTCWQNFTLPQELQSILKHTNFELKKMRQWRVPADRQTDSHIHTSLQFACASEG